MTEEELIKYLKEHGPLPQPKRGLIQVSRDGNVVIRESIRIKAKQSTTQPKREVQHGGETRETSEK